MKRCKALLLDIDGVLHISGDTVPGAIDAVVSLREIVASIRFVTNTSSRSRASIHEQLQGLGFDVDRGEIVTPAALAVDYCRDNGMMRVRMLVADGLREDLAELDEVEEGNAPEAIVLGDIGDHFGAPVLNSAFRELMDGAALVCLQHNRYWRSGEGLVLDVGAWAAALEYASGVESVVVGKPSSEFFGAALATARASAAEALMIGDDIEADVGGGLDAGIDSILVRTGKYRPDAVEVSGITPTETIDSIADLPALLGGS
jgi:HAD superfamily hydrolase (TIGR01458 family)